MKNLKALTDEERKYINDYYSFDVISDKFIVVSYRDYARKILHPIDKPFSLNVKKINRKVTISLEAINLWREKYITQYSLIDVQNAISSLIVTYQDLTPDMIENKLKQMNNKIKSK